MSASRPRPGLPPERDDGTWFGSRQIMRVSAAGRERRHHPGLDSDSFCDSGSLLDPDLRVLAVMNSSNLKAPASELGALLRHCRDVRGRSQFDLSLDTGVSQNQIRFV